jgi:hypothetical protein
MLVALRTFRWVFPYAHRFPQAAACPEPFRTDPSHHVALTH